MSNAANIFNISDLYWTGTLGSITCIGGVPTVVSSGGGGSGTFGAVTSGANNVFAGLNVFQGGLDSSSFGVGSQSIGSSSVIYADSGVSCGGQNRVSGFNAVAVGINIIASGQDSVGIGRNVNVRGFGGIALGATSISIGTNAIAIGFGAQANNANIAIGGNITNNIVSTVDIGIANNAKMSLSSSGNLAVSGILYPLITITGPYNASQKDSIILVDTTLSGFYITMPSAIGIRGKEYKFKNLGTHTFSLTGVFGQTFDGDGSRDIISQYDSMNLHSDGSNWVILF